MIFFLVGNGDGKVFLTFLAFFLFEKVFLVLWKGVSYGKFSFLFFEL